MIKWVEITNYVGETLHLELTEAEPKHGLIIKNITGLGPPKAQINTTPVVTIDGDVFNCSRLDKRNIVMTLIFTFADIIEDARLRTYKFFAIKRPLKFHIKTDNRDAYIYGYVESNEPNIFSKQEEAVISIICDYPYFKASRGIQDINFFGIEPKFEFVYENASLTDKLTEFGVYIDNAYVKEFTYLGDADVGMEMIFDSVGYWKNVIVYNIDTGEHMKIDTEKIENISGIGTIQKGDSIILNTNPGKKSLFFKRMGIEYNVFNALEKGTDWLIVRKGINRFSMVVDEYTENLQLTMNIDVIYEGV